jgi:hypothetical protein
MHAVRDQLQRQREEIEALRSQVPGNTAAGAAWHMRSFCECTGCAVQFYLGGRHHCRRCGASVCGEHFRRPLCSSCVIRARSSEDN